MDEGSRENLKRLSESSSAGNSETNIAEEVSKKHIELRKIVVQEAAAKAAAKKHTSASSDWNPVRDEASGKVYYYHTRTKEVVWTRPDAYTQSSTMKVKQSATLSSVGRKSASIAPIKIRAAVTKAQKTRRRSQEPSFVEYVIEVQVTLARSMKTHVWTIKRRYREFHALHSKMKSSIHRMKLSIPSKRTYLIWGKQSREFVESQT